MQFNLIDEQWIPVRRRDGSESKIAPCELTGDFSDNPVVALNSPRPDFNGALIQFLIGLVQTVAAPRNNSEWRKQLKMPPAPNELKEKFSTVCYAFELGGDGPRFMQDFEELEVPSGPIDGLLIDMPGNSTKKNNKDHFVKRNTVIGMCPPCCATALFAMQTNAPAGGAGFRTSLRGGGPLTTLIMGDERHATLWQLIWLNILTENVFNNICGNPTLSDSGIFPWLAKTRASEKNTGIDTNPEDMNPAVMFWGMPRRIRLGLENIYAGTCDLCGEESFELIQNYQDKNYGINFTGAWLHPLSPHSVNNENEPVPIHAQPGGISYRHWLGLIIHDDNNKKTPARIVHEFYNRCESNWQFRIWAFGYDMDNMKARCWYESTMPLISVHPTIRAEYQESIGNLIRTANKIASNTRSAIKKAWFKRPKDAKGDTSFIDKSFWHNTETDFYKTVQRVISELESATDGLATNKGWLTALCQQSIKLFDSYAWDGPIEDADPKRVVIARKELEIFNRGKKIKGLLGIPVKKKGRNKQAKTEQETYQINLPL